MSHLSSAPRLRCDDQGPRHFYGRYKGHFICAERDDKSSDWYCTVMAPDGLYAVAGWCPDSAYKPVRFAILWALQGAMLYPPQPNP